MRNAHKIQVSINKMFTEKLSHKWKLKLQRSHQLYVCVSPFNQTIHHEGICFVLRQNLRISLCRPGCLRTPEFKLPSCPSLPSSWDCRCLPPHWTSDTILNYCNPLWEQCRYCEEPFKNPYTHLGNSTCGRGEHKQTKQWTCLNVQTYSFGRS